MYRWYRALSGAAPGIADSLRAVVLRPYVARDSTVSYGYGWFVRTLPDGRIDQVSHTGGDGVFLSVFVWRPRERLFYYLVGNGGSDVPVQVAREIPRTFREAGGGETRRPR